MLQLLRFGSGNKNININNRREENNSWWMKKLNVLRNPVIHVWMDYNDNKCARSVNIRETV